VNGTIRMDRGKENSRMDRGKENRRIDRGKENRRMDRKTCLIERGDS